jgi:hypothetical protein
MAKHNSQARAARKPGRPNPCLFKGFSGKCGILGIRAMRESYRQSLCKGGDIVPSERFKVFLS